MPAIHLLGAEWPAPANILAASTTRRGGRSTGPYAGFNLAHHVGDEPASVEWNRQLLAASLDFPAELQWLRQVHGARAHIVTRAGPPPEADSLISRIPGIALCVLSADCLPIFVCNRAGDEAAIIHAGWRGLSTGIIENTLAAMQSEPEDLLIWLGPAIQSCHYEVGEDVREAFLDRAADTRQQEQFNAAFAPLAEPGKYHADLTQLARTKLRHLGATTVSGGSHCTHGDPTRFYSHRRDTPCGRMANLICIKPAI